MRSAGRWERELQKKKEDADRNLASGSKWQKRLGLFEEKEIFAVVDAPFSEKYGRNEKPRNYLERLDYVIDQVRENKRKNRKCIRPSGCGLDHHSSCFCKSLKAVERRELYE